MELPYESHTIDILKGEQFNSEFVKINPNSKIPAIIDPEGPEGKPLEMMESGSILIYLAEKSGRFLSANDRTRAKTLQWLFFQMANVGPMFGQFGHFYKYATDKCQDPYPLNRYKNETIRLLNVLDDQFEKKPYLAGNEYSIADIATVPWINCLDQFYQAQDDLNLYSFKRVMDWRERCSSRPAFQKGEKICPVE